MSWVTNVLVSYGISEDENPSNLAAFREWFEPIGGIGYLSGGVADPPNTSLTWGGTKFPECELWGGAYNHLDHDAFWDHMNRLQWSFPQSVQVLLMDQEDDRFQVWMIANGEFVQIVDGGDSD